MKIHTLHHNMLYPLKSIQQDDTSEVIVKNVNIQLDNANVLMLKHFDSS